MTRLRSLFNFCPRRVGIVLLHRRGNGSSILSQIFLKDLAIVVYGESHHAGVAVLRGIGNHGKPTDHFTFDQVAIGAAGSVLSLGLQDLVVLTVIGYRSAPVQRMDRADSAPLRL